MKQKSILNRIYLPLTCLVTVLSVSFRIFAMLVDYNAEIGYFDKKGLINAASIIVVCGSLLLFTYAFTGNKGEKLIATFTTPATYVPSAILVTSLIFFGAKTYERIKDFDLSIPEGIPGDAVMRYVTENLSSYVTAILVPLALLSAVYFILNATVAERYSVARASFGVCAVLFFALYASFLYFDTTLAINSPNKIVDQMAFIFAALFFLYEIRISLARECWHLYVAFGFVGATVGIYSSIPSLVAFFVNDVTVSHSVEENLLMLCVSLFIISRLVLASKLNPDKESEFVAVMREHATERNNYIFEKEEIERRAVLELYNRMNENMEQPTEENENELFGIRAEGAEAPEADSVKEDNEASETYIEAENTEPSSPDAEIVENEASNIPTETSDGSFEESEGGELSEDKAQNEPSAVNESDMAQAITEINAVENNTVQDGEAFTGSEPRPTAEE